jgi:hypothetical protein
MKGLPSNEMIADARVEGGRMSQARIEAAFQLENSNRPATLEEKRAIALRWLGDRYLLATPINKPKTRKLRCANLSPAVVAHSTTSGSVSSHPTASANC